MSLTENQMILAAWNKASNYEKQQVKKICKKYKVKEKPAAVDEEYTTFEFENGEQFICPNTPDYEDYELNGDAFKFAKKHYEIIDHAYSIFKNSMRSFGFEEYDEDAYFTVWTKNGKEYIIDNFAEEDKDIEISDIKAIL